jgi:adenylate cyclase
MTRPELQKSADMFEQALAKDAAYAPALAGLATVYSTLYEWFGARGDDLARAEDASARALALAPRLAEARVARGCTLSLSRRYDEAILEFEEALRLDPNSFDAHYYYARTRFVRGEFDLAADLFRRAAAVRREDYQSPLFLAKLLGMQGRAAEAKEAAREGLRRAQHVLELNPGDGRALSLGSLALYEEGDEAEAMAWSRRSVELNPDDTCTLVNHACLRARRGEKEEALRLLDGLFARGLGKRDWVLHDPDFDAFRGDPRFPPMVERLK